MEDVQSEPCDLQQPAPWIPIPARTVTSVEHPCIVRNLDKGITSLGGPVKLSKGLRPKAEPFIDEETDNAPKQLISVSLRPDDPFAKRLLSTAVTTNNLLLKVTVPKRTGRKRKRGSSEPFLTEDEINGIPQSSTNDTSHTHHQHVDAAVIFQTLQDNASSYKVAFAGIVDETHRFRTMPDLQSAAVYNDTMTNLRDSILPTQYSQLKKFNLNTTSGADLSKSVGPSADFLQMPIAFNYRFQQNTYVKYTEQGVVNLQKSIAYNSYTIIKPTDEVVPTGPKTSLPDESMLTPYLQTLIAQIKAELDKRPIITRHLLYNRLGWDKRTRLRQAAVYCGYFFESGPWREALVRWGVDPRKDPAYRKYQTVSFLSYLKSGQARHHKTFDEHVHKLTQMSARELEREHLFDGITVSETGNLFQFCDVTDPIIANILATTDIRATCAPTFQGWYHVGTWAKATVILKDKMNTIVGGDAPDDSIYERIAGWPEMWDDKEMAATYKAEVDDRQIHHEKKKEHDVMHNVRWAARNPRYAFEKMEAAESQARGAESVDMEPADEVEVPEDLTEVPDTVEVIYNEGDRDDKDVIDDDDDEEDQGESEDAEGEDVDDDDSDGPLIPIRTVVGGPAPFGGIFSG